MEHPREQVRIAAEGDRDMLGRVRRGLGAPRVHDDDRAPARDDRPQPSTRLSNISADVRCCGN
jgi:hypothetical protein